MIGFFYKHTVNRKGGLVRARAECSNSSMIDIFSTHLVSTGNGAVETSDQLADQQEAYNDIFQDTNGQGQTNKQTKI